LKARLAKEIFTAYYYEATGQKAAEEFDRIFKHKSAPEQIEEQTLNLDGEKIWVVRLLVLTGLARSNREARKLITEGGVDINAERVTNVELELPPGEYIIKVGKRRFKKVKLQTT
ncbi:MAG: S4 domain-containing protein, partial [Candidatus Sumerlaeia bacterium]|nr:S4 domain-containing protein [Candidatus Sumerlaeia bacterium]